jgi:hypothetical protein
MTRSQYRTVSPHTFYFRDQPKGRTAYYFVRDSLNGNRYVKVDKVTLEGTQFFAAIDHRRIPLHIDTSELYMEWGVVTYFGLPDVVEETFTSLKVGVQDELRNIDHEIAEREPFEEFGAEHLLSIFEDAVKAAGESYERHAPTKFAAEPYPVWRRRQETMAKLIGAIRNIELGFYDEALSLIGDAKLEIADYKVMADAIFQK